MNERIANYIEKHGPALLSAIMILVAGFFVSRWVGKLMMRWLSRKELQLEPPVRMLIVRLIRLLIFVFALVIAGKVPEVFNPAAGGGPGQPIPNGPGLSFGGTCTVTAT